MEWSRGGEGIVEWSRGWGEHVWRGSEGWEGVWSGVRGGRVCGVKWSKLNGQNVRW